MEQPFLGDVVEGNENFGEVADSLTTADRRDIVEMGEENFDGQLLAGVPHAIVRRGEARASVKVASRAMQGVESSQRDTRMTSYIVKQRFSDPKN